MWEVLSGQWRLFIELLYEWIFRTAENIMYKVKADVANFKSRWAPRINLIGVPHRYDTVAFLGAILLSWKIAIKYAEMSPLAIKYIESDCLQIGIIRG